MTLGIALLGTGNIAQRAFVPAVQAVDGARLVAVLSRDRARGAPPGTTHSLPLSYEIPFLEGLASISWKMPRKVRRAVINDKPA